MNMLVRDNTELGARLREMRQEMVEERAQVCQLAADKVDVEQLLHVSHTVIFSSLTRF